MNPSAFNIGVFVNGSSSNGEDIGRNTGEFSDIVVAVFGVQSGSRVTGSSQESESGETQLHERIVSGISSRFGHKTLGSSPTAGNNLRGIICCHNSLHNVDKSSGGVKNKVPGDYILSDTGDCLNIQGSFQTLFCGSLSSDNFLDRISGNSIFLLESSQRLGRKGGIVEFNDRLSNLTIVRGVSALLNTTVVYTEIRKHFGDSQFLVSGQPGG
mmetsp:Transcript_20/g.20  ORF Transcript_20/g.20 Transcript_20/m.20 type:complete len:213 (-) Transcript_20:538-1176(-)